MHVPDTVPDNLNGEPISRFTSLACEGTLIAPATHTMGDGHSPGGDVTGECVKPARRGPPLSTARARGKRPQRATAYVTGTNRYGEHFTPVSLAELRDTGLCHVVYSCTNPTAYSADDHQGLLMPELARATLVELHERHNLATPAITATFSDEQVARARQRMRGDIASATARVYEYWWRYAQLWLWSHGLSALPMEPDALIMLLSEHADFYSYSTLNKILWAIHKAHQYAGFNDRSPALTYKVAACLAGIARESGTRGDGKLPILEWMWPIWRDHAHALPNWKKGLRDLALLGLSWAVAGRPGEICSARRFQLRRHSDYYTFCWPFSKTDQFGRGYEIAVTRLDVPGLDVVGALDHWLALVPTSRTEPLFREVDRHGNIANVTLDSDGRITSGAFYTESLNRLLKNYVRLCGEPTAPYGGYSLRVGFVTWAVESGFADSAIMKVTRHKTLRTLRGYFRPDALFRERLLSARPVAQPFSAAVARGY
jgi:integrase